MPRNLVERCEVQFPVTQADLHKRLRDEILAAYLADNTKARLLQPDGEYVRAPRVGEPFSAQDYLMRVAEGAEEKIPERLLKAGALHSDGRGTPPIARA
jgi:polyphosphate kinase